MQQSEITCTYIVSEERIDYEDKLYLDIIILYTPGIYGYQKNVWIFNWNAYSMYKSWLIECNVNTMYVIIFWSGERISSKNNTI